MPPEVVAAWARLPTFRGPVRPAQQGRRQIAQLIGVEAALSRRGAGALLLATAPLSPRRPGSRQQLPDTTGMKTKSSCRKPPHLLRQPAHRRRRQMIDVETAADVHKAVSERTALMF